MRYWDASALVPLIVTEETSDFVRKCFSHDEHIVTWFWSRVEVVSAIERRAKEDLLSRAERRERRSVLERTHALADTWDEITDPFAVRSNAISLLARHTIRAADAAQLGAALLAHRRAPGLTTFVCLDRRLALAANSRRYV